MAREVEQQHLITATEPTTINVASTAIGLNSSATNLLVATEV